MSDEETLIILSHAGNTIFNLLQEVGMLSPAIRQRMRDGGADGCLAEIGAARRQLMLARLAKKELLARNAH